MAVASPAGRKHKLAVTANLCFKAQLFRPTDASEMVKRWFKSHVREEPGNQKPRSTLCASRRRDRGRRNLARSATRKLSGRKKARHGKELESG